MEKAEKRQRICGEEWNLESQELMQDKMQGDREKAKKDKAPLNRESAETSCLFALRKFRLKSSCPGECVLLEIFVVLSVCCVLVDVL